MTGRTDLELVLDRFLAEGPHTVADRAIEHTLAVIDRTPQRRGLPAPWRFPRMTTFFRLQAATLIAIVAIGGTLVFIGTGPGPATTPQVTATPAPTSAAANPTDAGCVVTPTFGLLLSTGCSYPVPYWRVPLTIEGTGRYTFDWTQTSVMLTGADSKSSGTSIQIIEVRRVGETPCAAENPLAAETPTTVAAYLTWLGQAPIGRLPRRAVTVHGFTGQELIVDPGPWPSPGIGDTTCSSIFLGADPSVDEAPSASSPTVASDVLTTRIDVLDIGTEVIVIESRYQAANPNQLESVDAQVAALLINRQ